MSEEEIYILYYVWKDLQKAISCEKYTQAWEYIAEAMDLIEKILRDK